LRLRAEAAGIGPQPPAPKANALSENAEPHVIVCLRNARLENVLPVIEEDLPIFSKS
jgi:hypothetical protein